MKLSVYLMHLQLAVICFGCWKGMQSDLAPIEGQLGVWGVGWGSYFQ